MKTNDILSEKQKLILELLKRNNIDKLKDFINSIETPLYFLNSTNFDLLTLALSLNCSFDIIKLIYNRYNYKTLNYVVEDIYHLYDMSNHKDKTIVNYQNSLEVLMDSNNNVKSPLLVSLEFSDFQSVEFLINKGAVMYFKINGKYILEILREVNLLTMRKLNFLLKNGFSLKKFKIERFSNFEFKYIKMCLENFVFDTNFIKYLLNLYKNKTGISKRKFNHIINNEINKIEIPMELYLKYLDRKDYRKVEYLYQYYGIEKTRSFKDFILFYLNYFDRNFNKKSFYDFFNFIINNETTLPFIKEYAIEENETIIINKKLKMVEPINNNTLKLEAFLKNNNYILHCLYSSKSEILNLINEHNVSLDVVDILRKYFLI
ncbi:hypothetical protein LY90DRAFT_636594 [Neocallimastix californiae]|uniref:Ankyrin n=1 Tax=Neocallimastix californiae TaxID=1754190 RepID=A0A1Y2EN28_9FUNG|nr:hypothetical protein LY90DRAFT_636594 [Neocallimastix californiae]|eukprot:ORY72942.1 hypothetical protein LY90DRAFT_636594 [Neocallimastix californiae]